MLNVFIKDILDKKIVFKYTVISVFVFLAVKLSIESGVGDRLKFSDKMFIYLLIALLFSVFFFVRTYVRNDRLLLYYSLPASRTRINESIVLSVLIDTLVRKVSIVLAVMIGIGAGIDSYIKLVFFLPGIVVIGCVSSEYDISTPVKIFILFVSLIYGCFIYFIFGNTPLVCAIGISLVIGFIYMMFVRKIFMSKALFRLKVNSSFSGYMLSNYFLKFFLSENVYVINTLAILVMVVIICMAAPKEICVSLACAIGAINTPLLTVFSTEEELADINNMLPGKYKSLKKDYVFILSVYFVLVQSLILFLKLDWVNPKRIVGLLFVTVVEVLGSYGLEMKYTIKGKKTTVEVWKNPRKYILPILVFFVVFVLGIY